MARADPRRGRLFFSPLAQAHALRTVSSVTPRFPLPRPPLKKRLNIKALVPALIIGGVLGWLGGQFGPTLFDGPASSLNWLHLALLPVYWLLTVAAHEAGHAAVGRLVGNRVLLFGVGPFLWQRTPSGLRFRWNTSLNAFGGLTVSLPAEATRVTPRRFAAMILGGPLASAVLAGAGFFVYTLPVPESPSPLVLFLRSALGLLALLSAAATALSLFPGSAQGFKTDGRRARDLLRGDAASTLELALLRATGASLAGLRPRALPTDLVSALQQAPHSSFYATYASYSLFHYAADSDDWSTAQLHLDRALSSSQHAAPLLIDTLHCEYAWLLATQSCDASAARAWLDTAGPLPLDRATRLRAEAAVALAEGKPAAALDLARQGLKALQQQTLSLAPSPAQTDWLTSLAQQAETRLQSSASPASEDSMRT